MILALWTLLSFAGPTDAIQLQGVVEPKPVDVEPIVREMITTGDVQKVTWPTQQLPLDRPVRYPHDYKTVFVVDPTIAEEYRVVSLPASGIEKLHIRTFPCPCIIAKADGTTLTEPGLCVEVWDE